MLLNLKQIKTGARYDGKAMDFDYALDLSAIKRWGEHPFDGPVLIAGTVTCEPGYYTVRYRARYSMTGRCSRCLSDVKRDFDRVYEHVVIEEAQNGESFGEWILAPGAQLDADELCASDILLELEGVTLCGEDCKGLCPKCGKNLNTGDCGCDRREKDPRFDAIRKLMEQEE